MHVYKAIGKKNQIVNFFFPPLAVGFCGMNVYVIEYGNVKPINASQNWRKEHLINLLYLGTDKFCHKFFSETKPDVIVTCGKSFHVFHTLLKLPSYLRKRWIHTENRDEIKPMEIKSCFTHAISIE